MTVAIILAREISAVWSAFSWKKIVQEMKENPVKLEQQRDVRSVQKMDSRCLKYVSWCTIRASIVDCIVQPIKIL